MKQRQIITTTKYNNNNNKQYNLILNSKYLENSSNNNERNENMKRDNNTQNNRNKNNYQNMIKLESSIQFIGGCWNTYLNKENKEYYISSSFIISSFSIISLTGIDYIDIISTGIQNLQVLCVEEDFINENLTSTTPVKYKKRKEIIDIPITNTSSHIQPNTFMREHLNQEQEHEKEQDEDEISLIDSKIQNIHFRTPWPCSHVEISVSTVDGNFISILNISTYCDSMPSSMSTPIYPKL